MTINQWMYSFLDQFQLRGKEIFYQTAWTEFMADIDMLHPWDKVY